MALIDRGCEHTMHVNAHSVTVKVVSRAFSFEYICEVDGAPIDAHDDAEVNVEDWNEWTVNSYTYSRPEDAPVICIPGNLNSHTRRCFEVIRK